MSYRRAVTITLELTPPQAVALEDMLYQWNRLGSWGASRWTAFYADGDGDFKPRARVDGRKPQRSSPTGKWHKMTMGEEARQEGDEAYFMDFDSVACAMRKD